jgi:hypothetical protein
VCEKRTLTALGRIRPEFLRQRARWYRARSETDGGGAWALQLAEDLERRADEIEAMQAKLSREKSKPNDPA